MNRIQNIRISILVVALLLSISCDNNSTNPTPTITGVMPPTEIEVSTRNETTIAFRWRRANGDTSIHTGYEIIASPNSGSPFSTMVPVADSSEFLFSGLNEGTIYTFTIRSISDNKKSTLSPTIQWSPARRTTMNARIYASTSSEGNGLELSSGTVFDVSDGDKWDICFDDRNNNLFVGSPRLSGYVNGSFQFPNGKEGKIVRIRNSNYQRVNTLDDIWEKMSLGDGNSIGSASMQFREQLIDLKQFNPTLGGIGFAVASVNSSSTGNPINYAKVLIKSIGSSFVQGSGNNKYIELEVSYQPNIQVPFALMQISKESSNTSISNTSISN